MTPKGLLIAWTAIVLTALAILTVVFAQDCSGAWTICFDERATFLFLSIPALGLWLLGILVFFLAVVVEWLLARLRSE